MPERGGFIRVVAPMLEVFRATGMTLMYLIHDLLYPAYAYMFHILDPSGRCSIGRVVSTLR